MSCCMKAPASVMGMWKRCSFMMSRAIPRHMYSTAQAHDGHSSAHMPHLPPPPSSLCTSSPQSQGPAPSLSSLLMGLSLQSPTPPLEYHLPVRIGGRIIDPRPTPTACELPTSTQVTVEKVSPAFRDLELHAPPPLSSITPMLLMPWLMRIRHKKMKKHKLRKLRKRMIFVHRKQTLAKEKKKERAFRNWERETIRDAEVFDAEEFIATRMAEGRRGGWGVDVFKDLDKKQ